MVVAAGGDEEYVAGRAPTGHVARLVDHVEAEDADVEVAHAVDVGRAQMHVADPHVGIDRTLGRDGRLDGSLRAAHAVILTRPLVERRKWGYASPRSGEGVVACSARGGCRARACDGFAGRCGREAEGRAVATAAGDAEALAQARAASASRRVRRRVHTASARLLLADGLAAPRDEACRERGAMRGVLRLCP